MLRSDVFELIANGESSGVEFKRDDVRPEQLARELTAFANLRGGRVLLGVDDDGTIVGLQRANVEEWIMDTVFGRYIHPIILPFYEEVDMGEGNRVAVVTVEQGMAKPYVVRQADREEIYIRLGSVTRRATREEQARLFQSGGLVHIETMPVSGTRRTVMDERRLADYLSRVLGERVLPGGDEEWEQRLCGLGFMTQTQNAGCVCSVAGLVLFGSQPRRYLRQAGVRWLAFDAPNREAAAIDDVVIDGPLVGLWRGDVEVEQGIIDRLTQRMGPFISREELPAQGKTQHQRIWYYPSEVIREVLANAFAHRDWTRAGDVEVALYSDRLEIQSPGALPNTMTTEKMKAGQRLPRNPLIIDTLRDYGYVEARGMGVRNKIIPGMRKFNGTEPLIEDTEDYLRVTLLREPAP